MKAARETKIKACVRRKLQVVKFIYVVYALY